MVASFAKEFRKPGQSNSLKDFKNLRAALASSSESPDCAFAGDRAKNRSRQQNRMGRFMLAAFILSKVRKLSLILISNGCLLCLPVLWYNGLLHYWCRSPCPKFDLYAALMYGSFFTTSYFYRTVKLFRASYCFHSRIVNNYVTELKGPVKKIRGGID